MLFYRQCKSAIGMMALPVSLAVCNVSASASGTPGDSTLRPWTPADSTEIRYLAFDLKAPRNWSGSIGSTGFQDWANQPERSKEGVLWSPNGQFFLSIAYSGDIQEDGEAFSLLIYSRQSINSAFEVGNRRNDPVKPIAKTTLLSLAGSAIKEPVWDPDSSGVQFLADDAKGNPQAFRLHIATNAVTQLTDAPGGIGRFSVRGDRVIYVVNEYKVSDASYRYPMEPVQRSANGTVQFPRWRYADGGLKFYTSNGPASAPVMLDAFVSHAAISPSGRMAAIFEQPGDPRDLGRLSLLRFEDGNRPIEIMTARAQDLSGARFRRQSLYWTKDSNEIIAIGVYPDDSSGNDSQDTSHEVAEVAVFNVQRQSWERLGSVPASKIARINWTEEDEELEIVLNGPNGEVEYKGYRRQGGVWSPFQAPERANSDSLQVEIRQGENTPPHLLASKDGREIVLQAPDPALRGVYRAPVQKFEWLDYDGSRRTAGLVLPRNYRPGNPIPVVIQPYFYFPQLFLPDGASRTGDAAQALAARGIAVLMVHSVDVMQKFDDRKGLGEEASEIAAKIDAIVDELVQMRIADPQKIGIIGFSRGGYNAHRLITNPRRTNFGAVIVADSFTGSYPLFLEFGARLGSRVERSPWADPLHWLENETSLNADRVMTPALFTQNGIESDTDYGGVVLQTMGAFWLNGKPLEYVVFRDGVHQLARPVQREAMMSLSVDWMAFWLLGEENPDPAKAELMRRWRKMSEEWISSQQSTPTKAEPGFLKTRANLYYRIDKRVGGSSPGTGDILRLRYSAIGEDGAALDNPAVHNVTIRLPKPPSLLPVGVVTPDRDTRPNEGIGKGWDQALRLLHKGETATLIMPSEIAQLPDIPAWPSGKSLRFKAELLDIQHPQITRE